MRSPLLKHTYRQRELERYSRWQEQGEQGNQRRAASSKEMGQGNWGLGDLDDTMWPAAPGH